MDRLRDGKIRLREKSKATDARFDIQVRGTLGIIQNPA